MEYQVVRRDDHYYVVGLSNGYDGGDEVLIYRYPEGDIDTLLQDHGMMHGALYDLFQVTESLKQGDVFLTEFGNFQCQGVHVIPVNPTSP